MKEKIKTFFCVLILLGALPYIITTILQGKEETTKEELFLNYENKKEEEEYLVGVVTNEMPVSYEMEALKAQAVIARTNYMAAKELNQELPQTISQEELLELWGEENFSGNLQKLTKAVTITEGVAMTFQGQYIYAAFHTVSAGVTRNGAKALGSENMPWLQEVESPIDIPSEDFLKVMFWKKAELAEKIKQALGVNSIDEKDPLAAISVEERDAGGYVVQMKVGDKTITGEEFRNGLELNSACFYLKEVEGEIRIVTKGLGHGLGLSQYGANALAQKGSTYIEILNYYYKNIEISD